jgi:hypothetical protein
MASAATKTAAKKAPKRASSSAAAKKAGKAKKWKSRAVYRTIEAGSAVTCHHCDEHVKFKAKERARQVICNVYVKGVWDRVEHYHEACYKKARYPYGQAEE